MDFMRSSARKRRMDRVKRRLRKLLRPNMGLYFAVLVCFCAAALYVELRPWPADTDPDNLAKNFGYNTKWAIRREGTGIYVQKAIWNGKEPDTMAIPADEMMKGGELTFVMKQQA